MFGPGQANTLNVTVSVNAGGNAAQFLQQVAQAAHQAAQSQNVINRQPGVPGGGHGGTLGGFGKSFARGGAGAALESLGGKMGAVGLSLAALGKVFDSIGHTAKILNSSFLTNAQKATALADEIPLIGDVYKKFREMVYNLTGETDRMSRRAFQGEITLTRTEVQARAQAEINQAEARQFSAANQARATQKIQYREYRGGEFDRSTYGGEVALREYETRLAAQDEKTRADRESLAASRNVVESRGVEEQTRADVEAKRRALDKAKEAERNALAKEGGLSGFVTGAAGGLVGNGVGNFIGMRSPADRDAAHRAVQEASVALARAEAQYQKDKERSMEASVRLAEKESVARKASLGVLKAEQQVLNARESRMSETATRVGGMSKGERIQAAIAVRHLAENDINNVPVEIQNRAADLFPGFVRKKREQAGARELEDVNGDIRGIIGEKIFKEATGGADFQPGQTLKEVRQQQIEANAKIRVQVDLDERATADAIAQALLPAVKAIVDGAKAEIEGKIQAIRSGRQISSNANFR